MLRTANVFVVVPTMLVSAIIVHSGAETAMAQQAVLYDFTATWCGPCQQVSPIVHKLQREGLPIQQVDIDKNPKLAQKFRVSSIPAFVLVVNGKEVKRVLGGQTTEQDLRRLLAMIPANQPSRQNLASTSQPAGNRRASPRGNNTGYETPVLGTAMPISTLFNTQPKRLAQQMPTGNAIASSVKNEPRTLPAKNPSRSEAPVIRAQIDKSSNVTSATPHIDSSAANVRIRIKDESGINYGSGTVIQSKPGISYVLTCGHIFRKLKDSSKVDVDIFTGDRFESYVGKVEKYDLDADVGLISIPTDGVLPVARLAVSGSQAPKGGTVISVGCSGGQPPTVQQLSVTALNRYTGPDNIECTGIPVQGRSGGGLFNLENEVVGVCIAADPKEKRGLYAGLKPILELVSSCGLESIVRQPVAPETVFANNEKNMPQPPAAYPAANGNAFANQANQLSTNNTAAPNSQAASEMLRSLQAATGAKLTIVIEDPNHPGQTRVVIIPSATPSLIADLTGELNGTQKISAHRRMLSQTNAIQSTRRNVAPMQNVTREEDRSVTMPTDFSVSKPYRRSRN